MVFHLQTCHDVTNNINCLIAKAYLQANFCDYIRHNFDTCHPTIEEKESRFCLCGHSKGVEWRVSKGKVQQIIFTL